MKINKIFFGLTIAAMALFTSCNVDNEGEMYSIGNGQCVAFTNTSLGSVEVPVNSPVYKIGITRGNSNGDFTGKVGKITSVVDGDTVDYQSVCNVSDFTFANGVNQAEISVDVTLLPMGKILDLTLEYNDTINLSPTYHTGTNKVNVKINKAYSWVSAGTCTFTDYTFAENGATAQNVAVEHAEATNLYRVIKPWIAVYGPAPDGFASDTGFQFTVGSDGAISLVASGGVVAEADQYTFCWVEKYVPDYCFTKQEGNTYYFEMLGLVDGDGYYTGFAFEFTWNK